MSTGSNTEEEMAEPEMDEAVVREEEGTSDVVVAPIENNNDYINEFSYTDYDSETNSYESETFFYDAESNMTEDEFESETNNDEIETTIKIRDQSGVLVFNETFTKDDFTETASNANFNENSSQAQGCMGYCVEKELDFIESDWFLRLHCMAFGAACAAAIAAECSLTCLSYRL